MKARSKKSEISMSKKTLVVSGKSNIASVIGKFQSNIKQDWWALVDSSIPAFSMSDKIRQGYIAAQNRGLKIRYITEITTDNLQYCKELMKFVELRDFVGIRASFAVSESEFVAGIGRKRTMDTLLYSNQKEIVNHHRAIFETFWENASPMGRRLKALEK